MADIISELKLKLKDKRCAIEQLQEEIGAIQRVVSMLEQEQPKQHVLQLSRAVGRPRGRSEEASSIVESIIKVLETHGPMHRKDLYNTLSEEGIKFANCKNPLGNLSAHLSINKEVFKPVGNGFWALKDYPEPGVRESDMSPESD